MASRGWMFTINNPQEEDIPTLEWKNAKYIVYQKEVGENGTEHFQGYLYLKCVARLSALKKLNSRAHWEQRRGSHDQARAYCIKEDSRVDGPWELGVEPKQGKRNDIHEMVQACRDLKKPLIEIVEEHPVAYVKYHKAVDKIRAMCIPERSWETEVFWFYGPTGTGKSRLAFEMCENPYVKPMGTKWFDGYLGQEDVIFDDLRGDTFKMHELLRLFDRYQMQVEYKGGMVQWCPKRIFVTTPFTPQQMFAAQSDDRIDQLLRRIKEIREFKVKTEITDYFDVVSDQVEVQNDELDRPGKKAKLDSMTEPAVLETFITMMTRYQDGLEITDLGKSSSCVEPCDRVCCSADTRAKLLSMCVKNPDMIGILKLNPVMEKFVKWL